jgi:FkbM family methyltransferase
LLGRRHPVITVLRPLYEAIAAVAAGKRGVEWAVNEEPLRIDPRARRFVAPRTEPELWEWLKANVRRGERVLDVGSFLGIYAIAVARWAGPDSRVLAFEPTPATAETLARHVEMNGLQDRVKVLRIALGEGEGAADIHEHSEPYRNAIGVTDPAGTHTRDRRVVVSTIDAVCERRSFEPTLIRMDVQGLELAVLKGARRTIARGRGRLRIVLEVHPQLWPLHGIDSVAFDRGLCQLGLRARPLQPRDAAGYLPDEHVELDYLR